MTLTAMELAAHRNFQYLDADCIQGLHELARALPKDPMVINVGAGFGTSALAFLESRPDLHLITVDAHDSPTDIGSLSQERETMVEAGFAASVRYDQIHSFSMPAGEDWIRGPVDLVFVDASHSYEACKGDALAWLTHLKPNGIMAFHDYWERYGYEVIRAVDEIMAPYEQVMNVSCLVAYRIP